MKYQKTHHTPEQIIDKLQRVKQMVAEGVSVESACQVLKIGLSTLYRWRKRYGTLSRRRPPRAPASAWGTARGRAVIGPWSRAAPRSRRQSWRPL